MPSVRTTCASRDRPRPARRAGSAPSPTRSATEPTTRAPACRARRPSSSCRPHRSSRRSPSMTPWSCAPGRRSTSRCWTTTSPPPVGVRRSTPPRSSPPVRRRSRSPAGDVLRYLAPTEPGDYAIDYAVYTTGSPALADSATVRIQVLPDDANRAPLPDTLEGRVLERAVDRHRVRRFRHGPRRRRRQPRPHRQPARERIGHDRRRRRVDPLLERRRLPRPGVVPLPRRGCARRDGRGRRAARGARQPVQSQPDHLHRLRPGAGRCGQLDPREPAGNDVDPTMGTLSVTDVRPDLPADAGRRQRKPGVRATR